MFEDVFESGFAPAFYQSEDMNLYIRHIKLDRLTGRSLVGFSVVIVNILDSPIIVNSLLVTYVVSLHWSKQLPWNEWLHRIVSMPSTDSSILSRQMWHVGNSVSPGTGRHAPCYKTMSDNIELWVYHPLTHPFVGMHPVHKTMTQNCEYTIQWSIHSL